MAYRIEENVTWRQLWNNLQTFLTELTTVYDISYTSATGDGILSQLSVPDATATTENWSLICTDANVPATFSVTGTVTGATASATVGTAYDNGIIKFTITEGLTPWNFGDIITFTSEATTSPPWTALTVENEPIQIISRFYNRDGSEKSLTGYVRAIEDKPKIGASPFAPLHSVNNETYLGTLFGGNYGSGDNRSVQSITFWFRNPNPTYAGTNSYGGVFRFNTSNDNYKQGPMSLGISGYDFTGYATEYSYDSARSYTIPIPNTWYEDTNVGPDDWILFTMTSNGSVYYFYLNDTYIGVASNMNYAYPVFSTFLINFSVSNPMRWNRKLEISDMQEIIADPEIYNLQGTDVTAGYYYNDSDKMPLVNVSNIDSDGNEIAALMLPQKAPYFAYYLSAVSRGAPIVGNHTEREWEEFSHDYYAPKLWNDVSGLATYMIGGEPNQVVAKTWFVATEDFIIIAYKIYDPSTSQQLPVYQIGYIGRTDTAEEMEYKAVIGTSSTNAEFWYTSNAAVRSGVFYTPNARFFSLTSYAAPTNIYYSGVTGAFEKVGNSYNIYPITYYQSSYNRSFGELYNLYGVQVLDVNHEDEFTIDGERYIALGDATRAGSTSLILVKLG